MVLLEDVRLDGEHRVRILDVLLQGVGHLGEALEQLRIDLPQRGRYGVLLVADVEADVAVVGVDHDLDGVANIVQGRILSVGLGVREVGAAGVGVDHPVHLAVRHDHVGIVVVHQERRDLFQTVVDVAVDQDLRIGLDIRRNEHLQRALADGEQQAVEEVQLDAARAFVRAVHVGLAAGIVEFLLGRICNDVVVRGFAEVDLRAGDRDLRHFRDRRDAVDQHVGLTGGGHLIHAGQGDAVAVGILQMADEPLVLDAGLVDLSGRQEDLGIFAVHVIAVHVHVVEFVIRTDRLGLVVELLGRLEVVDPHVRERAHVLQDVLRRKPVLGHKVADADVLQVVRHAGVVDVVLQIRALLVDLVGSDDQALDGSGRQRADGEHDDHQDRADDAHHELALLQREHEEHRGQHRQRDAGAVDVQRDIDIGVAGAVRDARAGIQQAVARQHEADRQKQKAQNAEDGDLRAGHAQDGGAGLLQVLLPMGRLGFLALLGEQLDDLSRRVAAEGIASAEGAFLVFAGDIVFIGVRLGLLRAAVRFNEVDQQDVIDERGDQKRRDDAERRGAERFQEFQFEHVEAHVVAEQRVRDVEFRRVQELQDLPPQPRDDAGGYDDAQHDAERDARLAQLFAVRFLQRVAALA